MNSLELWRRWWKLQSELLHVRILKRLKRPYENVNNFSQRGCKLISLSSLNQRIFYPCYGISVLQSS